MPSATHSPDPDMSRLQSAVMGDFNKTDIHMPTASMDPISRPCSMPTDAAPSNQQRPPTISTVSTVTAAPSDAGSSQLSAASMSPGVYSQIPTPTAVAGMQSGQTPTCNNCGTSTTPLWRRDSLGAVLCNACGLFLKLHSRPRPISLKTDVIKSRNRIKTIRPYPPAKKKTPQGFQDANGLVSAQHPDRSQKSLNDHDANGSRADAQGLYHHGLGFPDIDGQFSVTNLAFPMSASSPGGTASPHNGEHRDIPQTHEQLIAQNSTLQTRVRELDVIIELFRGRLSQLEHNEANARRGQEISGQQEAQLRSQLEAAAATEAMLRVQLEDSHRRENNLKRRLDELESELGTSQGMADLADAAENAEAAEEGPPAKKVKADVDPVVDPDMERSDDADHSVPVEAEAPPVASPMSEDA